MAQYNSLNVKLSNSQLNELKSSIKNENEGALSLSSNMSGNANDETTSHKYYLIHKLQIFLKLLLTNHQLILSYQKLKAIHREGFLVDFLVH